MTIKNLGVQVLTSGGSRSQEWGNLTLSMGNSTTGLFQDNTQ